MNLVVPPTVVNKNNYAKVWCFNGLFSDIICENKRGIHYSDQYNRK